MPSYPPTVAMISSGNLYVLAPDGVHTVYTQLPACFVAEDVRDALLTLVPEGVKHLALITHHNTGLLRPHSVSGLAGIVDLERLAIQLDARLTRYTPFQAANAFLGSNGDWSSNRTALVLVEDDPDNNGGGQLTHYIRGDNYEAMNTMPIVLNRRLSHMADIVYEEAEKLFNIEPGLRHVTVVSPVSMTAIRFGSGRGNLIHTWNSGIQLFLGARWLAAEAA